MNQRKDQRLISPIFKLIDMTSLFILFSMMGISRAPAATKPIAAALAQPMSTRTADTKRQQDDSKISSDAVKLFVKQVEIYGTIAKPQAVFIIQATDPKVDGLKIERHFFDHIFRNVDKSSIKRVRKNQEKKNTDLIEW